MFSGEAGAYLIEATFRCSIVGKFRALPTNIRLCWKGLQGPITQAYQEN
jgi:hypothetical protein